jgi:hypothetical protein
VNGGFEKPDVGSGFVLFSTGDKFKGWEVVGASGNVAPVSGSFTQNGFTFDAKRGKQWLDLTGVSNTATGVAQTFDTTASQQYTLEFYVGNVVNQGGIFGTTSTVNVFVNGNLILTATNSKGAGSTFQAWKKFSTNFTASSTRTTVAFINADPSDDTNNGLDAVSVAPSP